MSPGLSLEWNFKQISFEFLICFNRCKSDRYFGPLLVSYRFEKGNKINIEPFSPQQTNCFNMDQCF